MGLENYENTMSRVRCREDVDTINLDVVSAGLFLEISRDEDLRTLTARQDFTPNCYVAHPIDKDTRLDNLRKYCLGMLEIIHYYQSMPHQDIPKVIKGKTHYYMLRFMDTVYNYRGQNFFTSAKKDGDPDGSYEIDFAGIMKNRGFHGRLEAIAGYGKK